MTGNTSPQKRFSGRMNVHFALGDTLAHIGPVWGFSNCGTGFYGPWRDCSDELAGRLTHLPLIELIKQRPQLLDALPGSEERKEQLLDFLIQLRTTMQVLAEEPVGEIKPEAVSETAGRIVNLPRRTALVKIGTDMFPIRTLDTPPSIGASAQTARKKLLQEQTRQRYCRPIAAVEAEMQSRLGLIPALPAPTEVEIEEPEVEEQERKPRKRRVLEADEE